jgi:hypothetical protein
MVTLNEDECKAIHDMISMLSGGNPENVFAWDGSDEPSDPATSAFVKVYRAAGQKVPESCA